MNISIIQSYLVWEDKSQNLQNLGNLISPLYGNTDIVVLPEMFNTGFSVNSRHLSELPYGETFEWMKRIAEKGNFGLCGSYMVNENNRFYNRFVFVTPENEFWPNDKRHLFSMSGEDKIFSPGKSRAVFTFRGVRISPFICYDLRFPVWSRNRNDYDLAIYAANWPASRIEAWKTLLKARAIENQCYVAGANITGTDGNGITYSGESIIVNPCGGIIGSANPNEESTVTAEISMAELSEFRNKFPFLKDADNFSINF